MKSTSVSIVGLGYVGLSTGACLASRGIRVYGVDSDRAKVQSIRDGVVPFEEKGLASLLRSSVKKGLFVPGTEYDEAIRNSTVTFLTVGTPSRPDGSIELAHLRSASEGVGRELSGKREFHHVVVKSTAVPGTTQGLVKEAVEESSHKLCGEGFGVAANPEFLREGSAVADTFSPDAIVIGALNKRTGAALLELYRGFYRKMPPVLSTTPANAELIKYAINTYRATQLSFLNTFANLCSGIAGADIDEVSRGLEAIGKADPRYLKAGLGFGGSCLPKDLRAMIAYSRQAGLNPAVLEATLGTNEMQPNVAIKIARDLLGSLDEKSVAVLGLAFKPNTDDTRESLAISLVERLLKEGARVTVFDPKAVRQAKLALGDKVGYAGSALECIKGADCCIVATGWPEFARIGPSKFKQSMRNPVVVDTRRVMNAGALRDAGVRCVTLGSWSAAPLLEASDHSDPA